MKMPYTDDIKKHARCLIFDLDGTVLDSMDLWNRVDIQFLSKRGFEVTDDYTEVVKSVNIDDAAVYTKERFSLPETPQEIMDEWMDSETHRNQILNPNYNDAGVTVLDKNGKRYWVVEFGY